MKDITIHNFRCFEESHFDFKPGINLLIGDNSSGKTSLIRACNFVANSFFCGYSDENTVWKSVDEDDFRLIFGPHHTILPSEPISIEFHLSDKDLLPINIGKDNPVCYDYSTTLKIEKKSSKNSRYLISGLTPLKQYGSILYRNSHHKNLDRIEQRNTLPVFACFTTEDIHASRNISMERFKEYVQKPSFGYYECYDCRGLMDYWLKRLLVLQEAGMGEVEIETVRRALQEALGKDGCNIIDDIYIRPMRGKVFFHFTDGRTVEGSMLSDGYKRLVNIVLDIAMRCSLLNKVRYGTESYKNTHGTVIIDEVDEHLHPALQGRILKDLHRTFPRIQFIASTHAPKVISSVEESDENVVYRMWYDEEEKVYKHKSLHSYGKDANLILEEDMHVDDRDSVIKEKIDEIRKLINERNLSSAQAKMHELEALTDPEQPDLVRLRSMIHRLESRML